MPTTARTSAFAFRRRRNTRPARNRRLGAALLAALALTLPATRSHAVTATGITWGTPHNVTGDTDVSTTGGLVAAFNFGGSGVAVATVNTIAFQPFTITSGTATVGNYTLTETPATLLGSNTTGSASTPYSGLSTGYKGLLGSAGYATESTTMTLTINGLTVGHNYVFEFWNNLSGVSTGTFAGNGPNNYNTTATSGAAVALSANSAGSEGGLGQYDIGTFTAGATSISVAFTSTVVGPLVNGFELRDASVPEPGSLALLAAGSAGVLAWRRRRTAPGETAAK